MIYVLCGGLLILVGTISFLAFVKYRGANSNYTEFAIDENNYIHTYEEKTNYE